MISFYDIRRVKEPAYTSHVGWRYLEQWLKDQGDDRTNSKLELDPDYQRGHVWTDEKRVAYIESVLIGLNVPKTLNWNHPNWMGSFAGTMELVDGKQRLETARKFMRDEIKVFGQVCSEFGPRPPDNLGFVMAINKFQTRAEILQWYIDLNAGGVVHTDEEINRVRGLLAKENK